MGYSRFLLHHGKIVGARLSRTGCAQTRGAPCRGSLLPGYHPGAALFTVDRRLLCNPEQGAQCARCRQNRRHRKKLSAITLAIRPPPRAPKGPRGGPLPKRLRAVRVERKEGRPPERRGGPLTVRPPRHASPAASSRAGCRRRPVSTVASRPEKHCHRPRVRKKRPTVLYPTVSGRSREAFEHSLQNSVSLAS